MKKTLKVCVAVLSFCGAAYGMDWKNEGMDALNAKAEGVIKSFKDAYAEKLSVDEIASEKDTLFEMIVDALGQDNIANMKYLLNNGNFGVLMQQITQAGSKITQKIEDKKREAIRRAFDEEIARQQEDIRQNQAKLNSIKAEILKTKGTIKNMGDIAEETSKALNSFTNDDSLANRSEDSSLITKLVHLFGNLKSSCDEDTDLSKSYNALKSQSARNPNNNNDDNSNSLNGIDIDDLIWGSAQKVDDQKNSLETFFARMEDVLREVKRNEQQLRAEIATLKSQNSNLSNANQDQSAELERQTAELEHLRSDLNQKESNKNELEAERHNLQEKINKLNEDIENLKANATAKGHENNELNTKLDKLSSEKQVEEQKIAQLKRQIFSFNTDIKEISEKLARKKAKSKDRKRQLGDASAQIEQLKERISTLEIDKHNLATQNKSLDEKYKRSQLEIEQLGEEKNEIEKSIADYKNLVAKLRNNLATIGNVGAANALLAKDNALMKNKLANLNAEISVLNGRNDKAKKKDAELQLNQEKMKNKLANLDAEISVLNRRNDRAKKTDAELQLNQEKLTEYEQEIVAANFRRDIEYVLNELIYDAEFIDKSKPESDKIIDGNCNLAEFSKIKSIISRLLSENRQWNSSSFMERLDKIFGENFEIFDGDLAWIINKSTLVIAGLRRDYRQGRVSGNSIRREDLTKLKVYTRS